jgi:serine/threonine-protein phosphatase 2A regulatory subunit A
MMSEEILSLMKDPEAEVRALCISQLPFILSKLPKDLISSHIIPSFEVLSTDSSYHVRLALMETLCRTAKFIDPPTSMQKLFPIINTLIRDENFEVRMKFAENFGLFNQAIGVKCVISFSIPLNMQMMNDPRWRIRLKVVEALPAMAEILGLARFTEQLSAPLMKWVEDPVFGVREAAIQAIFEIANGFGREWTKTHIFPLIEMLVKSPVFMKRLTALKVINQLAELFEYQVIFVFLKTLACDPVPNIRFNVMKTVRNMMVVFKICNELIRVVEKMRNDGDPDVRFYALQTFNDINRDSRGAG